MIYNILQRFGVDATLITRTVTGLNRLTGERTFTEQRWTGVVGFVPFHQLPRFDQVVVADAWFITDQPVQDKTEIHCKGRCYVVVKQSTFDEYTVIAAKAATMGETHLVFRADHEPTDAMQGTPV